MSEALCRICAMEAQIADGGAPLGQISWAVNSSRKMSAMEDIAMYVLYEGYVHYIGHSLHCPL